jgi:ferredoxin
MSLDTFKTRTPDNVPGKFYVGDQCTDCDLCRATAPHNFARNDEHGYSYVKMQPQTAEQEQLCREAAAGCCVETIHDDGDAFDWNALPAVPNSLHPGAGGTAAHGSSCCGQEKKGRKLVGRGRWIIFAAIVLMVVWYIFPRAPHFSGDTASSIDITMSSPVAPDVKPEVLLKTSIISEAACAPMLALLRSARDHADHKCADIGSFHIHYTNGRTDTLAMLPGHDPTGYEFRFGGRAYRVPRDQLYQALREAGVDATKMPQSEH